MINEIGLNSKIPHIENYNGHFRPQDSIYNDTYGTGILGPYHPEIFAYDAITPGYAGYDRGYYEI